MQAYPTRAVTAIRGAFATKRAPPRIPGSAFEVVAPILGPSCGSKFSRPEKTWFFGVPTVSQAGGSLRSIRRVYASREHSFRMPAHARSGPLVPDRGGSARLGYTQADVHFCVRQRRSEHRIRAGSRGSGITRVAVGPELVREGNFFGRPRGGLQGDDRRACVRARS